MTREKQEIEPEEDVCRNILNVHRRCDGVDEMLIRVSTNAETVFRLII